MPSRSYGKGPPWSIRRIVSCASCGNRANVIVGSLPSGVGVGRVAACWVGVVVARAGVRVAVAFARAAVGWLAPVARVAVARWDAPEARGPAVGVVAVGVVA